MGQPGMGVLIHRLFGGGGQRALLALESVLNKSIASITQSDKDVQVRMADGSGVSLYDDGQLCCESRYMRSDDKPEDFVGAVLRNIELRDALNVESEWDEHEVQFLVLVTDRGNYTVSSHNEHNGYYGGFAITCAPLESPESVDAVDPSAGI